MITSYSQNFEDVMLWRALKHIKKGFYIDIGAQHPVIDSVSLAFYEQNWRGIHVEPNSYYVKLLHKYRRDETVLHALISDIEGSLIFYEIAQTGLSTGDPEIAKKHATNGFSVKKTLVPAITLEYILNNHAEDETHWLKIDVEGMEETVIRSWGTAAKRPWIIVVESTKPLTQIESYSSWDKFICEKGYDFVYFDGLNRFYLSHMHLDLINAFHYGPNIFDGFVLDISTSYCRNQLYKHEELKSKNIELQCSLEENKRELKSIYNTTAGHFIKLYKKIKHKSKKKALVDKEPGQEYVDISTGNIVVKFHTKALSDSRGIGRVSRELLKQLQQRNTEINNRQNTDQSKTVFFYSTIHHCPVKLPQPSCILIHDVIPLLFPDIFSNNASVWNTKYKSIAQQACKIVTISQSSATDISRLLDIPIDKIEIIYNGITALPVSENKLIRLPKEDFIVYLGAYDQHKNIDIVLRAMLEPQTRNISLVMIGNNKKAKDLITNFGLNNRVYLFGQLSDDHAGFVISKALALVFPSLYEGFGLPPLEAGLLNTPSICSYRPAMTEVMADAALFASPDKPDEWANAICSLKDNADLRNNLASLAKEKAEHYTWEKSSAALFDVLKELDSTPV
ncbi:MAG: FkbM family methyltransferase [Chlorobium phaeobacteroides]|jgi:FkbM family methyltransferase|nr:FkbM family methyltransferase [Chlorobium phaeobacteroides]